MTVESAALLLFLVLDPFGNIPFFLAALERVRPERRTRVVARELLIALAALLVFLFLGRYLLALLGISEPALTVAGGIILFLIALKMIFPPLAAARAQEDVQDEPFVVPLAIPYVAGPSAFASVLFIMSGEPDRWPEWLAAVGLAWGATSAILLVASRLSGLLGPRGLVALERLMGLVLVTIAVQMTMSGIRAFWSD